jgi:hypothetical protein
MTDRVTIVSCSPSDKETASIQAFSKETGIYVRYLVRENRGFAELARAQYFTGAVGSLAENTEYEFVFQMQDHYLDTGSNVSRYGPEVHYAMKGDVVPDGFVFDLDFIQVLANEQNAVLFFCDRLNPCWFKLGRYIAPSGGNFIIKSSEVLDAFPQSLIHKLIESCDNTYDWAVFAEFMWGYIFFREGRNVYDLKRKCLFTTFEKKDFYLHGGFSNPRFKQVFRMYHDALGLEYPWFTYVYDVLLSVLSRLVRLKKMGLAVFFRRSFARTS